MFEKKYSEVPESPDMSYYEISLRELGACLRCVKRVELPNGKNVIYGLFDWEGEEVISLPNGEFRNKIYTRIIVYGYKAGILGRKARIIPQEERKEVESQLLDILKDTPVKIKFVEFEEGD